MILLSALIGPPLELFGTEPNQELMFKAYGVTFANTETWVKGAFRDFFNNCWGPNWWSDGRQIQSIEAIVQSQSPDSEVSDSNNTEGAYAWDIRFTTTASGDGTRHQRFYYRPTEDWTYNTSISGCQNRQNMLMGYDNSGPEAVGVPTGTFTTFDQGYVPTATWELQTTSYCIGNVTVTKYQCGKWYLGPGCHTAPEYTRPSGPPCVVDANGDMVEVFQKKTGSGTQGNKAFEIHQKVDEDKPFRLTKYNCSDEWISINPEYYATRDEADAVGAAWVDSQYDTYGMTGSDDWPAVISRPCCERDNSCDDDDDNGDNGDNGGNGPAPIPCGDPNAVVLDDGNCGVCKSGYEDKNDGNGCVEIQDDNGDNGDDTPFEPSNTLKYIGLGVAGLMGLLVISKLS